MGTNTGSDSVIDYTEDFAQMIAVGEQIRDELTLIREALYADGESTAAIAKGIAEDHRTLQEKIAAIYLRASQEQLGIFTRSITEGDGGLSRAAMINALKQSAQLDSVRAEMTNPTPMP